MSNRLARGLVRRDVSKPFEIVFNRRLEEIGNAGKRAPGVLALNPGRFRSDLEILGERGAFRILAFPFEWQARLIPYFYDAEADRSQWFAPRDQALRSQQEAYRRFLVKIGASMRSKNRLGAVLGAAVHYRQDVDWGVAFHRLGIPYIVLHKENLVMSRGFKTESVRYYATEFGRFQGDHIVVHTDNMKEIFVESGFATEDQVTAVGALRMDRYARLLESPRPPQAPTPQVVLFSFFPGSGLGPLALRDKSRFRGVWSTDGSSGFSQLFYEVHVAFARLAVKHPEIKVTIKTKWGGNWLEEIDAALARASLNRNEIPNLTVQWTGDAQQMMLESDVVCGFASTAVLEGAVAGKPVIVPHFAESQRPENRDLIPFADELDLFDVAESPEEIEKLVERRLDDPSIDEDCMTARRRAFERHIGPLDGKTTERYVELIASLMDAGADEDSLPSQ